MATVSQGQITIVDFNDAIALTSYVSANQPLTQIYNPDNSTYTPSYVTTNMVFTPSLFTSINGSTDQIAGSMVKNIQWFDGATEITASDGNYTISAWGAGSNRPLTIKANVLNGGTTVKTFTCQITVQDPNTLQNIYSKCNITIQRVNNGGGTTLLNVTTPSGNIFKNNGGTNITAVAQLLRASGVDTTNNTYQWQKLISGTWTTLTSAYTGYNTDTLTIKATDVDGVAMFKCNVTDNDATSATYNQVFSATCTIADMTDPIQVVVVTTNGDVLKNGGGSTTLISKLYQGGSEVDSYSGTVSNTAPTSPTTNQQWYDTSTSSYKKWNGTSWVADTVTYTYTYTWSKVDKDGNADPNFGGAGVATKTGKFLTVGDADVNVKSTFTVAIA